MKMMRSPLTNDKALRGNLAYLRQESLNVVGALTMIIGYVWLWFDIWPVTGAHAPLPSWIGGAALVIGVAIGYRLRLSPTHLATYTLSLSMLLAATCAALTFHVPEIIYLFTLPILFGSVLVSQGGVILMAALAILIVLGLEFSDASRTTSQALIAVGVIAGISVTSLFSVRNLHTTLAWFESAYESAYRNEQVARDHEAELRRALKSLDDMAHRLERMNYTLTVQRNQAEEARRLKQQFAQTISHELRTPLNIITAFTDLMAQSPDYYGSSLPAAYMRDLSIIHRNAKHLQTLVNDVLDLSRIEAAQMVMVPEETDPMALVQEAVQTVRSLVEMRGLRLTVQIADGLPKLWLDATRIRQVLFNLLNNAARFTEVGGITVRAECREDCAIFSVQDTGPGIAVQDIDRLFLEFHQLNAGTRRQHNGAGLGLAISRRVVELHNGHICVESELGNGSAFFFRLPICPQRTVPP